ncbi:MAG TPA: hypothetical protein VD995_03000 [Azospirillum sp.]|nr:hypothetical protein [Azospirillum sp.]
MLRKHEIDDFYRVPPGGDGGVLLRRWEWVEIVPAEVDAETEEVITPAVFGPRCIQAPLSLLEASDEEIAAQIQANAEVRALVAADEPVPEPVAVPVYDAEGNQIGTEMVVPEAPAPAPPVPPASYRTLRAIAYLTQIGGSLSLKDAAGNQFDALFHDRQGSGAQLAEQDETIAAIKARYRPDAPWRALGAGET